MAAMAGEEALVGGLPPLLCIPPPRRASLARGGGEQGRKTSGRKDRVKSAVEPAVPPAREIVINEKTSGYYHEYPSPFMWEITKKYCYKQKILK